MCAYPIRPRDALRELFIDMHTVCIYAWRVRRPLTARPTIEWCVYVHTCAHKYVAQ